MECRRAERTARCSHWWTPEVLRFAMHKHCLQSSYPAIHWSLKSTTHAEWHAIAAILSVDQAHCSSWLQERLAGTFGYSSRACCPSARLCLLWRLYCFSHCPWNWHRRVALHWSIVPPLYTHTPTSARVHKPKTSCHEKPTVWATEREEQLAPDPHVQGALCERHTYLRR